MHTVHYCRIQSACRLNATSPNLADLVSIRAKRDGFANASPAVHFAVFRYPQRQLMECAQRIGAHARIAPHHTQKNKARAHANIAHSAILSHSIGTPIECDLTKSARFGEHKSVAAAGIICLLSRDKGMAQSKEYMCTIFSILGCYFLRGCPI